MPAAAMAGWTTGSDHRGATIDQITRRQVLVSQDGQRYAIDY